MMFLKKTLFICSKYLRHISQCSRITRRYKYTDGTRKKSKLGETGQRRIFGIIAHIDAGKTTTTERMLYYSGFQRTIGEVHDGDTTMDYLEQERQRGITIQSAAITFPWRDTILQLVDTPGHVDFTIEVERCLRVMDGAVTVLDASAGVEAQTLTVWHQAERYNIPSIFYLNKMDKENASYRDCLEDIEKKLNVRPLLLQLPVGSGRQFRGVIDLISGHKIEWTLQESKGTQTTTGNGALYTISNHPVTASSDPDLYEEFVTARSRLCDSLSDVDDTVALHILETENASNVSPTVVQAAVKSAALQRLYVPVFMGSSYRNVGVQLLMDAIVQYLPSPLHRESSQSVSLYAPDLCALAFKLLYSTEKHKLLVFVRIYSGSLRQGSKIYNATRRCVEKPSKIFIVLADKFEEVDSAGPGTVIVLSGLEKTKTGDTIVSSEAQVIAAKKKISSKSFKQLDTKSMKNSDVVDKDIVTSPLLKLEQDMQEQAKTCTDVELDYDEHEPILFGIKLPDPVCFCSVEADSMRFHAPLEKALAIMEREDPSLRVKHDHETGQLVLGGMGELHLEIVRSRLVSQHHVQCELGPLQVAYKEEVTDGAEYCIDIDKSIGDTRMKVRLCMTLDPVPGYVFKKATPLHLRDNADNLAALRPAHLQCITAGVRSALLNGPLLSCPVVGADIKIKWFETTRHTSSAFVSAMANKCTKQLLRDSGCRLLEPMMLLSLVVDQDFGSAITGDLNRRRAELKQVTVRGDKREITALVPLAELLGYSTAARKLSSGTAFFTLELSHFAVMTEHDQKEAVKRVRGFY